MTGTSYRGGSGRVRIEGNTLNITSSNLPPNVATFAKPGLVNVSPVPALSFASVGGVPLSSAPGGSFDSPDVTLPSSTTNPVTVNLAASNIPVGTIVKVTVTPRNGSSSSYNSSVLSGTDSSSTATASVSLSNTMSNVLRAEATFAVQTASNLFPVFVEGDEVKSVRVASVLGESSSIYLVTESGREIPWQPVSEGK